MALSMKNTIYIILFLLFSGSMFCAQPGKIG